MSYCKKCALSRNHPPVIDNYKKADVMWIGLSAKVVIANSFQSPLDSNTNTGKIVSSIESELQGHIFYKTNAVKCPPIDANNKLRYPTSDEMELCFNNLMTEIEHVKPRVILLLGDKVASFIFDKLKVPRVVIDRSYDFKHSNHCSFDLIPIHHPSYIRIFKYREMSTYQNGVINAIKRSLGKTFAATETTKKSKEYLLNRFASA